MSKDLVIQVNVNPQTAQGPTETQETANVVKQTAVEGSSHAIMAKQAMDMMARQAMNFALSNIGELSGNASLQRRMQSANQMMNLAAVAVQNPYMAVGMAAMQIGMGAANTGIENRNQRIENDYNRKLKVNTYNNNRKT